MKGYLIKVYLDDRNVLHTTECYLQRVQGSILAQQLIEKHRLEQTFKVPKKWIYPIPEDPTDKVGRSKPHFCLIVEDMNILEKKKTPNNGRKKLSSNIPKGLFIIVKEGGFWDSLSPQNVPFCGMENWPSLILNTFICLVPFTLASKSIFAPKKPKSGVEFIKTDRRDRKKTVSFLQSPNVKWEPLAFALFSYVI